MEKSPLTWEALTVFCLSCVDTGREPVVARAVGVILSDTGGLLGELLTGRGCRDAEEGAAAAAAVAAALVSTLRPSSLLRPCKNVCIRVSVGVPAQTFTATDQVPDNNSQTAT